MKIFNIDWRRFFEALPVWSSIELPAREAFLTSFKPSAPVPSEHLGDALETLLASGLMERTGATGNRVQAAERFRPFLRAARAMHRVRILESPDPETLRHYAIEHWSHDELRTLTDQPSYSASPYYGLAYLRRGRWVEDFLRSQPTQRDPEDRPPGEPPDPGDPQRLVAAILEHGGPVAFSQLEEIDSELDIDRIARAIYAPLAAGVLFASLDSEYTPRIGLWPEIVERRQRPPAQPPEEVRVEESFGLALLVEDLATFLRDCAARPPRRKANSMDLYLRDKRKIADKLAPTPDWLPDVLCRGTEERVELAQRTAYHLDFTTSVLETATSPVYCHCSDRGRQWLRNGPEERLRSLADPYRRCFAEEASISSGYSTIPVGYPTSTTEVAATVEALRGLEPLAFVPLNDFLTFHAQEENPLSASDSLRLGWGQYSLPSESEIEKFWRQALLYTLDQLLAPFGGIRWGLVGSTLCFAITEVGRYILGLADSFNLDHDHAAQVVVQPNFEIVFLSPSPHSAALLAPIARRRGNEQVGTIFEITRSSVLDAAASGMEAQEILRLLEDASTHDLPTNVRQQIETWCAQLRRVRQRYLTIIECPDRQTARRVLEVLGRTARPLTETMIELKRETLTQSQRNKLAEAGLNLEMPSLED